MNKYAAGEGYIISKSEFYGAEGHSFTRKPWRRMAAGESIEVTAGADPVFVGGMPANFRDVVKIPSGHTATVRKTFNGNEFQQAQFVVTF